jgi:hypothetical protein
MCDRTTLASGGSCVAGCPSFNPDEGRGNAPVSPFGGVVGLMRGGKLKFDFLDWAFRRTRRPIWEAEWDAWGHCLCGAFATFYGSRSGALFFGELHEDGMDWLAGAPSVFGVEHDSGPEDRHNQAIGSMVGQEMKCRDYVMSVSPNDIDQWCRRAYLDGRLRIGPSRRNAYTDAMPQYLPPVPEQGRLWLPIGPGEWHSIEEYIEGLRPETQYWVEVIEPGSHGEARGPTAHPERPLIRLPLAYEEGNYRFRPDPPTVRYTFIRPLPDDAPR